MARNPVASITALLTYYSFDLHGCAIDQLVQKWLSKYPPKWVMSAVVEALYQGRYKAASVNSILFLWYLRGQPLHHFDYEFLDIVCGNLFKAIPIHPITPVGVVKSVASKKAAQQEAIRAKRSLNTAASLSRAA